MDTQKATSSHMFRIKPKKQSSRIKEGVFGPGRYLLGRTESCDLLVNSDAISAIHAVLEIDPQGLRIYDMNSTNGTYVQGEKVVTKDLKVGDSFSLANVEFVVSSYSANADLPPVLEALEPAQGQASTRKPPKAPSVSHDQVPSLVYPLALDPRADNTEYIFEDAQTIYPIFKYDYSKQAAEVIILHEDRVFSVDYVPAQNGTYSLAGILESEKTELEFPYLGKTEKVPFIEVNGNQVSVHKLFGYDVFMLSDKKTKSVNQLTGLLTLNSQDIVRFTKGQIQIYVRVVEAPPKVSVAPFIRRDPLMRKNLFAGGFFGFLLTVIILFSQFENIEEEKEEKAPERLATILYKQKLTVSKNKAVEKTPEAPKVVQKAPPKPAVQPTPEVKPQPEVKKPDVKTVATPKSTPEAGKKTAPTKQIVKRGDTMKRDTRITDKPAAPKSVTNTLANNRPKAFSTTNLNTKGPVDVYKSADFSASVNTLMAKGGSLSGIRTQGVSGSSGSIGAGISGGSGSSVGNLKKAEIGSNVGSLTGNTQGVIGESKGAEGLSAKKAVYTAGIPAETVVLGSMDPDVIRRILLDHLAQFRYCYQSELERAGTEVQGVIKLDFAIGASGHVSSAGVADSNLPTQVKKCVVGVLRGIQFPEPMGGGTVEVKQPMNFYPKKI
jgi:outer membrane biosynthesis protein TonB